MKRRLIYLVSAVMMMGAMLQSGYAQNKQKKTFTLWQIPSQVNTIGNIYVFKSAGGKVIVMDGGTNNEESYLRGFLAALGNEVELWIVSHPHDDHIGTLTKILQNPGEIKIKRVMHSEYPEELIALEQPYDGHAREFYKALRDSGIEVTNLTEPGLRFEIDGINIKVLGVTNPEITNNPYNNSSSIYRVWDNMKSMVFLGDAGVECGNKVLNGPYRADLDCDYLQMAHHGQQGCDENFYKTIKFRACLWPTPSWVWNNDIGGGFNTHILKTIETRNWMDEIGITEHYVSCEGLAKIE